MVQSTNLGNLPNAAGAVHRSDLNTNLRAIVTRHYGPSPPPLTYSCMEWWDATERLVKVRSVANNAWTVVGAFTADGQFTPYVGGKPVLASAGIKHNLSAAVDPASTDDSAAGYSVGSMWINVQGQRSFVAIGVGSGVASWRRIDITSASDLTGVEAYREWQTLQSVDITSPTPTVDLTSGSPQNYRRLRVRIRGLRAATNGDVLCFRVRSSGAWRTGASDYWQNALYFSSQIAGLAGGGAAVARVTLAEQMRNDALGRYVGEIIVTQRPGVATVRPHIAWSQLGTGRTSNNVHYYTWGQAGMNADGVADGVRIHTSTGGNFAEGEIFLDGSTQ